MPVNPIGRRSLLGGLIASAFAPLAGLLGGRAQASTPDLKVIGEAAGTLKPGPAIEPVGHEYKVVMHHADGIIALMVPTPDFGAALRQRDCWLKQPGYIRGEIRKRPVGEWETMQLPES